MMKKTRSSLTLCSFSNQLIYMPTFLFIFIWLCFVVFVYKHTHIRRMVGCYCFHLVILFHIIIFQSREWAHRLHATDCFFSSSIFFSSLTVWIFAAALSVCVIETNTFFRSTALHELGHFIVITFSFNSVLRVCEIT